MRGGRLVPAERVEAALSAAELVERARRQAGEIVAEARAEAEALLRAARAEGLEQGRTEAAALLAAAAAERDRALSAVRDDVVGLAMDVARKVVGRELELSPTAAAEICAAALGRVRHARSVVLRVSPADAPALEAASSALRSVLHEGAGLRVVADEAVGPGGCVVETELGRVDARLEVQLAALERALGEPDG